MDNLKNNNNNNDAVDETHLGFNVFVLFVFFGIAAALYRLILTFFANQNQENSDKNEETVEVPVQKPTKELHQRKKKKTRHTKQEFKHPLLYSTLKCVKGEICDMDFSNNGKYLATCSTDNTILIWDVKDLGNSGTHRSVRVNVEFDYASLIKWSPDNSAFIINKCGANNIDVFKIEKNKSRWIGAITKATSFQNYHSENVIGMGIASNGKYIMSCSKDNELVVLDLKGNLLAKTDTYTLTAVCAKISPCGKFIAVSGWSPDVKVWEVLFNKNGDFQELKRVFELSGHTSGISDVAFDADSSHMATISKDGTWKLYDTKIDYKRGESPHLLKTVKYEPISENARIALSHTGDILAVITKDNLLFYSAQNGNLDYEISNIFDDDLLHHRILFDASSKYILLSGNNKVHVLHNITWYSAGIADAKEKLKQHQTSATKERLNKLIKENEAFLDSIQQKHNEEED